MVLPLIPIAGAIFTIIGLGIDYSISMSMENSVTQMEALLNSIEYGMSFSEFISSCWLIIALGICVIWIGLAIAFPKNKRKGVRK